MSNFKIAVLAIFSICIVAGVAIFALSKNNAGSSGNLVVWGTVSDDAFNAAYKNSTLKSNKNVKISYFKKDPQTFESDFVEALAEGNGPDLVIMRDDEIYKQSNKLFLIPYANYSERNFKDRFIEEGELFLEKDGILALPFIVDPMVMYWNRDIFSNNAIANPPKYWDEIYPIIDKVTKKTAQADILQSAIAFGEWDNVTNAKEIVSMILLQAGTPITAFDTNGKLTSALQNKYDYPILPSFSGVNFYTQFSNPTSPTYTWNRSLPSSLNFFLSGQLAMYVGFASDIFSIQQKNSNLNFDLTYVPQIRNAPKKVVFGHMYAISIVKQSRQIPGAFAALDALTQPSPIQALEGVTNLPPVRRDLLAAVPTDAYKGVFYNSALVSHSFLDPDPAATTNTFRDMIKSITSGQAMTSEAINRAHQELNSELK